MRNVTDVGALRNVVKPSARMRTVAIEPKCFEPPLRLETPTPRQDVHLKSADLSFWVHGALRARARSHLHNERYPSLLNGSFHWNVNRGGRIGPQLSVSSPIRTTRHTGVDRNPQNDSGLPYNRVDWPSAGESMMPKNPSRRGYASAGYNRVRSHGAAND